MKIRYLLIIISIIILAGCSDSKIVKDLGIEEGCYIDDNGSENLLCFTEDKSYYDVLYKNNTYYRDPYYRTSPPTEERIYSSEYEAIDGVITITYKEKNSPWQSLVCSTPSNTTMDCTDMNIILGQFEKNTIKYTKVEKEFTKEIIENLPIYERNKEFDIIFDGKTINCHLTRSYSITNAFSNNVIANCLKENLQEEYTISQLDKTGNWQIYPKSVYKNSQTYDERINELNNIIKNYSYSVTVNGKTFGYVEAFPINPYITSDKMIVNIVKK